MKDHTEGGKYRILENVKGDVIQEGDEMRFGATWSAVSQSFVGDKVYLTDVFRRPVAQEPAVTEPDGGFTHNIVQQITFPDRDAAVDALVRRVFGAEPVYLDECRSVASEPDPVASEPDPVVEAMNADARRLEKQGQPTFTDLLTESGLPPFPPVPEGYDRWEYRGVGWKSEETTYAFKSARYSMWCEREGSAEGHDDSHYIEAVKDPTPPPPTREHAVSVLEPPACGVPDGLPPLPPVPEGYDRWEYRGMGWESDKPVLYGCAEAGDKDWGSPLDPQKNLHIPNGTSYFHYIEAVKDPTPPPPTHKPVVVVGVIDAHGSFDQTTHPASEWDENYPEDAPHRDVVLVEKLP